MNKVIFQEEKQHISINLNQSNNYYLHSFESKDLVPVKLLKLFTVIPSILTLKNVDTMFEKMFIRVKLE